MADRNEIARREEAAGLAIPGDARGARELIQGTMGELERALDGKNVIGEPMTFGTATVVPLLSVGFGFGAGAGGGGGTSPGGEGGQGGGGGGVAGGGMKPVAVLVIEDGKVRLEAIPSAPSGIDKLSRSIADAIDRRSEKRAAGERNAGSETATASERTPARA